jgi:sulfur carrier protein ThiS
MKLKVKLYGTLSRHIPGYQHLQGIEVEIPEGATAKKLLDSLKISEKQGAVVIMDGRILKASDTMHGGVPVNIVQPLSGG